jgi:hypothetical protein
MEISQITVISFFSLLILGIAIYFISKDLKKSKLSGQSLSKKKAIEDAELEKQKQILKSKNPEEYKSLIDQENQKTLGDKLWNRAKIGLWIFAVPHFLIEVIAYSSNEGSQNAGIPVVINFVISRYFIKRSIYKKNKVINSPILYSLGVSFIVFSARVLLYLILTNTS